VVFFRPPVPDVDTRRAIACDGLFAGLSWIAAGAERPELAPDAECRDHESAAGEGYPSGRLGL